MYQYPVHRDGKVGGTTWGKESVKGGSPSPNLNPKLQGMPVATHVDDILTRGGRAATVEFWTLVAARFPVKEWNIQCYLIYKNLRV